MKVTLLGHSCLLVEAGGARVLIDPGAFSSGFAELTGLDAVLVTHEHLDHLDVERLPALLDANDGVQLLAEPATAHDLSSTGLTATPLHPGEDARWAGLSVQAVGGDHAVIHPDLSRIGNIGLLLTEDDGPTLFHPGDALDTAPPGVDLLAVPLAAPWSALQETVDFVRAVAPAQWFGVHDALLSTVGRATFLRILGGLVPESSRQVTPDDSGGLALQPS